MNIFRWQGAVVATAITVGVTIMMTGPARGADLGREEDRTKQEWVRRHLLEAGDAPFSFMLAGRPSAEILAACRRQATSRTLDRNRQEHVITWDDTKTGLRIRCEATEYLDLPAVDWVLYLTNQGTNDTPILDGVRALDMTIQGSAEGFVLHHSRGDDNTALSFAPIADVIAPGPVFDVPRLERIAVDGEAGDWGDAGFRVDALAGVNGDTKPPAEFDPAFRLGWDERGLLVCVRVKARDFHEAEKDDQLYDGDGVELYLAPLRGAQDLLQAVIAPGMDAKHPELRLWVNDLRKNEALKKIAPKIEAVRTRLDDGYLLGARLPWAALGIKPKVGVEAGFQFYAARRQADGRLFHAVWYPQTGTFSNSKAMHRIRLAEKPSPAVRAPVAVPKDAVVLAPVGGRSSQGNMPYFNVDARGEGVAMAVGWTGQWQAEFQLASPNRLRVAAGQQTTHFRLLPGETIRTPRILLAFWKGPSDLCGNNRLRQVVIQHYLPRRQGNVVLPPICGSVAEMGKDGSYEEPHVKAMPIHAQRGLEVFWSDMDPQHWYPGDFPNGTGNWMVDPVKYPHGLKPIGDAAHQAGLEYLLWYEPERVAAGTQVEREHPGLITKIDANGFRLFRLDDPAARRWLTDLMDKHMTEAGVDWIRQDFNFAPLPFWKANDAPDRQGITEAKYVEGLYAMWDELRKRHPSLVIDICASGGRRLDIETSRYGMPLWHSDLQCEGSHPAADQLQNGALFRWVPLHACGQFALDPDYGFRSAMTGGGILCSAGVGAAEADVKKTVTLMKRIRPYTLGDFYPLFPHDTSEAVWYGYQFHLPATNAGMAILFRRKDAPDATRPVALQDIDPKATYEVTFEDTPGKRKVSGADLAAFRIEIPTAPGSAILYYRLQ